MDEKSENKKIAKIVKKLLEKPFWIDTIETQNSYSRFEDDSYNGNISVQFTQDGDGWITILSKPDEEDYHLSMRFRMPLIGGWQSPRVRNALLILAEAIRLDNIDAPQDRRKNENN
jgi:hypothetical protein